MIFITILLFYVKYCCLLLIFSVLLFLCAVVVFNFYGGTPRWPTNLCLALEHYFLLF